MPISQSDMAGSVFLAAINGLRATTEVYDDNSPCANTVLWAKQTDFHRGPRRKETC